LQPAETAMSWHRDLDDCPARRSPSMTPEPDIAAWNNMLIMVLVAATSCLSRRARNAAVASLVAVCLTIRQNGSQVVFALPSDCVNGACVLCVQ